MLKGFKFPCANGNSLSILEIEGLEKVSIGIQEASGRMEVLLSRDEWLELCDLKYKLDVNDPEEKAEFIPAIRAERVAGEEL